MSARNVVRATELNRVMDIIEKRGLPPDVSVTLLPNGAVEFHKFAPAPANDAGATDAERRAWDEALAG